MQSVTYPHFDNEVSPLPAPRRDWAWAIGRVGAFFAGAGAVWVQVHYTWASLPHGDVAMKAAPVLFAVGLAGSLVAVECHWHRSQYWKVLGWLITFAILFVGNMQTTVTRVAEVRALKSAESEHAGDIQKDAREALKLALGHEEDARNKVRDYCEAMIKTTATTTEPTGKKRSRHTRTIKKTETSVDPRCEPARVTLADTERDTEAARTRLANSAVSSSPDGVSPAAQSVSNLTGFDAKKIDHAMDFVQPLGLDALALIAFLTAFSGSARREPPAKRKKARKPETAPAPVNGTNLVVKGIPQSEVNTLVERWITDNGLPVDKGMGACLKLFMEWSQLPETAVSFVTFGRAFDALGIERRSLNGRKVVAGRRSVAR